MVFSGNSVFAAGPSDAFQRNLLRTHAVNRIADAIIAYTVANSGYFPTPITATATNIGDDVTEIDICADLVPSFEPFIGWDPSYSTGSYMDCTTYDSGFTVSLDASNVLTVSAPYAELGVVISVTR
jgi:hypothetical protein